jgi:hypothetical protein
MMLSRFLRAFPLIACLLVFGGSAVPAGKRLTITNVSGAFDVRSQPVQYLTISLEHGAVSSPGLPPSVPPVYLPTIFQGTSQTLILGTPSNVDEFVVNAPFWHSSTRRITPKSF